MNNQVIMATVMVFLSHESIGYEQYVKYVHEFMCTALAFLCVSPFNSFAYNIHLIFISYWNIYLYALAAFAIVAYLEFGHKYVSISTDVSLV